MNKLLVFILLFCGFSALSQTKQDYIYNYAKLAVQEMETARIPASITLAQGILESRFGTSQLSTISNNHFGIKCHKGWEGKSVKHDDDAKDECFRKYNHPQDSFKDHSAFLSTRGRYSDLFRLSIFDYKGWAKGLKKAGYATNPKYADHLIKLIEEEQLYVFDRMGSYEVEPYIASLKSKMAPNETFVVKVEPIQPKKSSPVAEKIITVQGGPAAAIEESAFQSRDIFIENDIKTVFTFSNDSPSKIAALYDLPIDKLYAYNEWPKYLNEFTWGMKVYLQPKRTKNRDVTTLYHKVLPGETMYQISQQYGIKSDKLYKRNLMIQSKEEQPRVGELISLRKKIKTKPFLRKDEIIFSAEEMQQQTKDDAVTVTDDLQIKEVAIEEKTKIIQAPIEQPEIIQPVNQTKTEEKIEEDIWGTYPSTVTEAEVNNEQQLSGRSIIYDQTPLINQQTTKEYKPEPDSKPTSTIVNPPTPKPTPTITYHKVVSGDTLYGLSKKYNISVATIKEWNKLTDNNIKLGQKLIVSQ